MNEYQTVDGLIEGIKGTTDFLSNLFSSRFGLVFVFIIFSVIVSKLLF
jgi:hypothetical protein